MLKKVINQLMVEAAGSLGLSEPLVQKIDQSPRQELGDYSTNLAINYARKRASNPIDLAGQLTAKLIEFDKNKIFSKIEVAKPGFINFFFSDAFLQSSINPIHQTDHDWGKAAVRQKDKVIIEFVSANPTGPLHVGHGRWAVIGDVIARLLSATGQQVTREYYVNNVGNQVEKLWTSIMAARTGASTPEGGYGGAYIKDIQGATLDEALNNILDLQKRTLAKLGVNFDSFFMESLLHRSGLVKQAIEKLTTQNLTFEEGGATWFKSQEMGDDKNRVLVREDGQTTYFAADIAYHLNKFERGFDQVIDIWGTDHHGYVYRLKAALKALDLPIERFEIIIGQLVTLYRGNEPIRMSKRTGEMVTLQEVLDEIGTDATRFFFAATDVNSHLDFDLELAKKQSNDNPVYYVQYAHARICSIIKKAQEAGESPGNDLSTLDQPAERALMLKLLSYPDLVEGAAQLRHPHRLTEYGKELAVTFHHFYEKCRVLVSPSRLALAGAVRITLRNVLELLGISAPETM